MTRRFWIGLAVAVVALGTGGYAAFQHYKIYLPGLIGEWRDPRQPTQEVVWNQGPAVSPSPNRMPNIIVILADDLGYNDISAFGGGVAGGIVKTPRIDSLMRDGARFRNAYAANATCSPSRAAIMTGRYPSRFGFEFTSAPVLFARTIYEQFAAETDRVAPPLYFDEREADMPALETLGLPPGEVTIAELLRGKGYHTLLFGKWHLGEAKGLRPTDQGFDESLGFYQGASLFIDEDDPLAVNAKVDFDPIDKFLWANLRFAVKYNDGPAFKPSEYMTDYLANQAAAAIKANRNRPFFMYLAFNAPHTPLQALKSDYDALSAISDHRLRTYGAMIRALDRGVGTVLDTLEAEGLADNTLVIFTSDNGGANYIGLRDINKPYRGWKATFFEGGIQVPFFIRWPSRIAPGTVLEGPAAHFDIFATAAAAAGAALPSERPIDGVDLVGGSGGFQGAAHLSLFWRSGHYKVVRADGWKLQVTERPDKVWLFDLNTDPTEQHNVADQFPDRVAAMKAMLAEQDKVAGKPLWPALIEAPIRIDAPLGEPVKPGEEYIYWAN